VTYPSPLIDLLVDGTSVQDYATILELIGDLFTTPPTRGSNYTIPGVDGVTYVPKPLAAYSFSIGVALLPSDPDTGVDPSGFSALVGQWVDNWRALTELCAPGAHTVTRVLPSVLHGTITETCNAEVVSSIAPTMVGPHASRAVLDFVNLDGYWTPVVSS
jgi:hypothetical protein